MANKYHVTCPTCGAEPGMRCRSLTSGRTTDTHVARIDAAWGNHRDEETNR